MSTFPFNVSLTSQDVPGSDLLLQINKLPSSPTVQQLPHLATPTKPINQLTQLTKAGDGNKRKKIVKQIKIYCQFLIGHRLTKLISILIILLSSSH